MKWCSFLIAFQKNVFENYGFCETLTRFICDKRECCLLAAHNIESQYRGKRILRYFSPYVSSYSTFLHMSHVNQQDPGSVEVERQLWRHPPRGSWDALQFPHSSRPMRSPSAIKINQQREEFDKQTRFFSFAIWISVLSLMLEAITDNPDKPDIIAAPTPNPQVLDVEPAHITLEHNWPIHLGSLYRG